MSLYKIFECWLTDANSDEERNICEHLPQYVPEVPFSTAVTVLHQLGAPQNCKEKQQFKRPYFAVECPECCAMELERAKVHGLCTNLCMTKDPFITFAHLRKEKQKQKKTKGVILR